MSQCTVIIVNWNLWGLLTRFIDKLRQQVFRDFRVMVIDNASSQQAPAELGERYPEVQFIANAENVGFAAANNQGILSPGGTKYIALLSPDAFPESNWLQQLMEAAWKYLDYAAFSSRQLMDQDIAVLDGDGDVFNISGLIWRDGHGRSVAGRSSAPK